MRLNKHRGPRRACKGGEQRRQRQSGGPTPGCEEQGAGSRPGLECRVGLGRQ